MLDHLTLTGTDRASTLVGLRRTSTLALPPSKRMIHVLPASLKATLNLLSPNQARWRIPRRSKRRPDPKLTFWKKLPREHLCRARFLGLKKKRLFMEGRRPGRILSWSQSWNNQPITRSPKRQTRMHMLHSVLLLTSSKSSDSHKAQGPHIEQEDGQDALSHVESAFKRVQFPVCHWRTRAKAHP